MFGRIVNFIFRFIESLIFAIILISFVVLSLALLRYFVVTPDSLLSDFSFKSVWEPIFLEEGYYDEGFFATCAFCVAVLSVVGAFVGFHHKWDKEYEESENKKKEDSSKYLYSAANDFVNAHNNFTEIYTILDIIYHYSQGTLSGDKKTPIFSKQEFDDANEKLKNLIHNNFARISNYLSFFEPIALHVRKEQYGFYDLNDLFNYRFFLAVRNSQIREACLECRKEYFYNIEKLKRDWTNWRKREGKENGRELLIPEDYDKRDPNVPKPKKWF